jgi:GTPase SAR1 family protein
MPVESSISQDQPINVKLLMLGHESVGKSSLLLRFTDQQWLPEQATATIGVDTWVSAPVRLRPVLQSLSWSTVT